MTTPMTTEEVQQSLALLTPQQNANLLAMAIGFILGFDRDNNENNLGFMLGMVEGFSTPEEIADHMSMLIDLESQDG